MDKYECLEKIEKELNELCGDEGWYWDNGMITVPDTAIMNDPDKNFPALLTIEGTVESGYYARYHNAITHKNELVMSVEILGIISNLDDEDDASEYARLYIKAQKEAVKEAGSEYDFDIDEVYRLIKETDCRIG